MKSNLITIDIKTLQQKAEDLTLTSPTQGDQLLQKDFEQAHTTQILVTPQSTLEAVNDLIDQGHKDAICLKFASAKNAGGGFLNGSQAQEESFSRSTGLYPCQMLKQEYYQTNRKFKSCIYTDYMIYSPSVPIIKDDNGDNIMHQKYCAIITAPAVNAGVVKNNEPQIVSQIEEIMLRRIRKVLAIALDNEHHNIVLGAWGCGVFQNDPNDIAQYFHQVLSTDFKNTFQNIIFAIYAKNDRFIRPFKDAFEG